MIVLTSANGSRVAVNPARIEYVRPNPHGPGCFINFESKYAKVRESFEEVLEAIRLYPDHRG